MQYFYISTFCILKQLLVLRSEYASVPFSLMTTFPNKELTDDKQTIKEPLTCQVY